VGGDAVFALLKKYPEWEPSIRVLVRDLEKGKAISTVFPKIQLVVGDLNDANLLEEEAGKADIVLNFADSDHPASAFAITRGAKRHASNKPVFMIHTSGTGILTWETVKTGTYGELEHKVYNDWDGVGEVTSLPDAAAHRNVDKIFLEASDDHGEPVRVAIVCPPTIYGLGRGPGNKRSQQLYDLARMIILNGKGVRVGKGENRQTHIHIHDLSDIYVALVEEAAAGGGKATWGREGYYFASRNEHVSVNSLLLYNS
jgi:hypothetical protein